MTPTPKHEATDAMGMESQRGEGPLSGKSGEAEDICQRLDDILIEQSPMHPFGCATWEEESRIAIDMAKDFIRRATTQPAEQGGKDYGPFHELPESRIPGVRYVEPGWLKRSIDHANAAEQSASSPVEGEGDILERLRPDDGCCAFCGRDPYEYVDNGVGMERVAVTCCDEGIALYQHGDEVLSRQVALRYEAAAEIERLRLATRSVAVSSEAVDQIATMIFDNPKIPGEFNLSDARELARSILEGHPAHEAGEVERLSSVLTDLVSWFDKPVQGVNGPVWVITAGDQGADDAVTEARAALEDKS